MAELGRRLLNVDDYESGRYARTRLLREAGFEVVEAASGAAALRAATSQPVDLILLDVNLPDMSGLEVCRRLKADPMTAAVPVVQVSATFVGDTDKAMGLNGGADAYLTEPVEPPVLVATVHALLRLRRAEEALRISAVQWQATFDAIRDGICLLDASGTIVRCNPAFAELFGLAPDAVIGHTTTDLWAPPLPPDTELPFLRAIHSGRREASELPQGDRWCCVTADPLSSGGRIVGAVCVVSDVTERKRAEAERATLLRREAAARAEAEAANHAKDDFLATLSHELRAPLNVIVGWTRMLRSGSLDAAATSQALETLERNSRLLGQLIADILDVSRIIAGKLRLDVEPVDLTTVIHGALEAVRTAARARHITLETQLGTGAVVLGDPARLQQVVWNLLSNGVKFTPAGGRVAVSLEAGPSTARITVRDTGQGISGDFLPYVFDRFRQADAAASRRHSGLGLGLAIVRHLVELHGGAVEASSPGEGQGATFTVTVPLVSGRERPSGRQGAGAAAEAAPSFDGRSILVVEDDPDTQALLLTVLRRYGATVHSAVSVADALATLDAVAMDVVISDIAMPGETGYMLVRQLQARGADVPVIALTAYARPEDAAQALAAGFRMHLAKPVDPAALIRAIQLVLPLDDQPDVT
jgi:PAS domain S-box-containing protein